MKRSLWSLALICMFLLGVQFAPTLAFAVRPRVAASGGSSGSTVTAPATGAGVDTCTGDGCAIGVKGFSTDAGFTSASAGHSVTLLQDPSDNLPTIQVDGTGRYVFGAGAAAPKANNGQSLGLTSLRWTTLFANGVDLNVASGSVAVQILTGAKVCLGTGAIGCMTYDGANLNTGNVGVTTGGNVAAATGYVQAGTILYVGTVPSLITATPSLTFGGTGASITGSGASFVINVGTGSPGNSGTITFGTTATHGYNCLCEDETASPLTKTKMSSDTTTTCVITNYTVSTGSAANWAASDKIHCVAVGY